jgi:hypothetical protein
MIQQFHSDTANQEKLKHISSKTLNKNINSIVLCNSQKLETTQVFTAVD